MRRVMCGVLFMLFPIGSSAESVTDLVAQPDGFYSLKIDNRNYVALSSADVEQAQAALAANAALTQKLAEVTAKLQQYQSMTNQYEELRVKFAVLTSDYKNLSEDSLRLNGDYSAAANNLVTLNQDYGKLVKDYDSLTQKYREAALRSRPRSPFDIGIGAVSVDNTTRGIAMVGAGTPVFDIDLRAWLFGGQDTYGVLLGASF